MTAIDAETPTATAGGPSMRLITDQLTEERNAKTSLEKRAVEVITTSGTLVTLLFALAALATKDTAFVLGTPSRWILVLAVAAFLTAAVIAILAARPRAYQEVSVEVLTAITEPATWAEPAAEAEPKIARGLVRIIAAARTANARKSTLLRRAVTAELVAIGLVALAVSITLATS